MLSLMLIVIPVCVHFIFMLFLPCINIHLTKITQLSMILWVVTFHPPNGRTPFTVFHWFFQWCVLASVSWLARSRWAWVGWRSSWGHCRSPSPPTPVYHLLPWITSRCVSPGCVCFRSERRSNTCSTRTYFSTYLSIFLFSGALAPQTWRP